jgi:hypothetical protein
MPGDGTGEDVGPDGSPQRDESPAERLDRNLAELLQELRVAQIFVQFLFAALLAIPFQQKFDKLTEFERDAYAVTLVLTLASAVLLVAPVSFHRVVFRHGMKKQLVEASDALMKFGLVALAGAMTSGLVLVLDVVTGRRLLFWTVVPLTVVAFVSLWYAWPHWVRREALRASAGRQDR